MSGSKVVFVGNIPYEQTEEQLIEIFSEVGPVVSFRLVFERETAKPRGYGFCEFQDERTAASAVRNLNGREIGNRSLKVDFAESDPARNGGRDLEDGSYMRNIAGPSSSSGPAPPPPMGGPVPPRNIGGLAPPPPFMVPPQQQQQRSGGPPMIPQPGGPPPPPSMGGPNPSDAISAVLATMTPQNVFDLIQSMKVLGANEPDRAKAVLNENPQLSYALFQALLMMNLVEPSSLQRMFPAGGPKGTPTPHMSTPPQQHMPTGPQPLPPHMGMGGPPPPPHHLHAPPPHGFPGGPPPPPPAQQPGAPLPQPTLEQQRQLMAQVMALTPKDIESLPEAQRANIIQLRAQLMGGNM
ncbi:hypothetical protein BGZ83_005847 [Gryganskiella cystojenkinii]|nr:hypothetical protein BGZ83_005847 [Gryganskiella cystojenkinii]